MYEAISQDEKNKDSESIRYDSNSRTLKWEASADFLNNNLLDGREIQLIFTAKTPLQSEKNIDNQAVVAVDNVSNKTKQKYGKSESKIMCIALDLLIAQEKAGFDVPALKK